MNHLVVLQCIEACIKLVCQRLCGGEDLTEEGESLEAFAKPEGIHHSRHINDLTRTHSPPHQRHNLQHLYHHACKITN